MVYIFEFPSIALRCLDKSFTLMEMVREMNIFTDSGTAGIDSRGLQTNYIISFGVSFLSQVDELNKLAGLQYMGLHSSGW